MSGMMTLLESLGLGQCATLNFPALLVDVNLIQSAYSAENIYSS